MIMCSGSGLTDHGRTAWEGSSKKVVTSLALVKMSLTSNILYECLWMICNFIYPLWLPKHAGFMEQHSCRIWSIISEQARKVQCVTFPRITENITIIENTKSIIQVYFLI